MGTIIFMIFAILEFCPIEGYNWDFGFFWILILIMVIVTDDELVKIVKK